jgi:hypothetical protein
MRRTLLRARLLCAFAIASASASAEPKPAHVLPLAETLKGPAKEAYASGALLLNHNDFAGAVVKYEQAYDLSKDSRLLFDMAICEKGLRHYTRMQKRLRQFQTEQGAGISADDKAAVDGALAVVAQLVGSLQLTVSEAGATVEVDGEAAGVTPLAEPLALDLGKHKLAVSKSGFEPASETIEIAGGSATQHAVTLVAEAHVARLVVTTDSLATVWLDGKVSAKGRLDQIVPPGPHEIRVTAPGKRPYKTSLDLRNGETHSLEVTLTSERIGLLPWIGGGAVVAIGAVVGGYFLFKPSDTVGAVPAGKFGSVSFSSRRP